MLTYNTKTDVAKRLGVSRPAIDTAIKRGEIKKIILTRGKKEIKFYVIVKEAIIYLLE